MSRSSAALSLALAAGLLTAWLASCKSNDTTSPGYGGGGGGATPELNGNLPTTGSTYSHTFATAGSFGYHCSVHPSCALLMGTIVVVAPGTGIKDRILAISQDGGSGGPYGSCSALSVQRDTVYVGDTITWTNNSPVAHTVVSH